MEKMIRILVVDDERIVRKGIVNLIHWEKYGMKVIGEAGSGEEALAFLVETEIDLLFTDLEMPGMSGIELIRKVRVMDPSVQIVVLTMHQQFDYIQTVLRFGVIDYITKAQIEKESIDFMMENIAKRYAESSRKTQMYEECCGADAICALCALSTEDSNRTETELAMRGIAFYGVKDGWYIIKEPWEETASLREQLNTLFYIKIKNCRNITYAIIGEVMELYGRGIVFREYLPEKSSYVISLHTYLNEDPSEERNTCNKGKAPSKILELGMQMDFIVDEDSCRSFLEELRGDIIRPEEMAAVLYPFHLHWIDYTNYDLNQYFDKVGRFQYWYEWEEWIVNLRDCVRERLNGQMDEIVHTSLIHRATAYLKQNMKKEIALDELLKLTGMGRSHFSKHFKRVTGETFVTYLNDLRIEAAKKYLEETNLPIYQISYQVGYANERYFRKSFHSRTGEQPRKYRNRMQSKTDR